MNRKSDNFTIVNRYLNEELTEPENRELEMELASNPGLAAELDFHLEVECAVQEKDIAALRENMKSIINQHKTAEEEEPVMSDSFNFGLAEETNTMPNAKARLKFEDIISFNHSFPKIHLYQHLLSAKENIYQYYKDQQEQNSNKETEVHSPMDDKLFEDIQMAVTEEDVLDLRANLKQIASSVSLHSYSSNDIHEFVDGTMEGEQRNRFEQDLLLDLGLENEVRLYRDVDLAIGEEDIMQLRASLGEIRQSARMFSSGIEEIEGYINNELSEKQMAMFEDELVSNRALYAEIELVKEIDQSIQEKDIIQLRSKLRDITARNSAEKHREQIIDSRFWHRKTAITVVAASLILLLGITGLIRYTSDKDIYSKYYTRYETAGISRSSEAVTDRTFFTALQKYNKKDYQSALTLLQQVVTNDQGNMAGHFYSGVSLQELGRYASAIQEYQAVVQDRDNLFTEQAQWYIGLCMIQLKDEEKAIQHFKRIALGKGFYQQKAAEIVKKMDN